MPRTRVVVAFAVLALAACNRAEPPAAEPSVAAPAAAPVASAAPVEESFIAIGTEPFWNATITGGKATYTTPEDQAGQTITVTVTQTGSSRQFAGTLAAQPFLLKLRQEACSDGMSDRNYSYAADLTVNGEDRKGCAEPGTAFKPE